MIRLPKNPENWTGTYADKAIDAAWTAFKRYEARIDFNAPQEQQDDLYRPYQHARQLAVDVARYTRWRFQDANKLP